MIPNDGLRQLAKMSHTPSPEARKKIDENRDGYQRSQESKIVFRGPLPVNRDGREMP